MKDYVEQRDGDYLVAGTRISLASLVTAFNRGAAPESIKRSFPVLSLEEVYGALAYYLAHEVELDDFIQSSADELNAQAAARREKFKQTRPELYQRLAKARLARS